MQNNKICPYPGLRPFTEEEAIYFKGRDTHIEQITEQLSLKKFLMLTGASGDGKSSLIYAGLIPNARAGFFKAKYNNWIVADFRPERSPLQNMAKALNKYLGMPEDEIEKELRFGFSSLVNLYKKSKYYFDPADKQWDAAGEAEKKKAKREAANLLILADQFEEFFTNPENYSKGAPSIESQTVVNLLVETAKIAQEADIPIYIVCTMRSDYIGQCASFRGLPEMIGFSQFFVPRLKRKEIQQVIEEPAMLSGDKISPRLTEILINELNDGFDQLPVLQHTLNAIWNIADKGNEQMDLLHLAKLCGISSSYLPKPDQALFKQWFDALPEFRKQYFKNHSLGHVLSAHADVLFETADEVYNKTYAGNGSQLSKQDAQLIVKTAFQCLTKIDESRAVRNRMTLQEIANVINRPDLTPDIIGKVLNLFRMQGNTFIAPFITDSPDSLILKPDTILDITHEALIRNWGALKQWADEEYNNLLVFQDLNKQLARWISSKKSNGYLLPIGPLAFFEDWVKKQNPNKFWLARYDESEKSKGEKIANAEETLQNAKEFLKSSARRLFFTRTVMKYGANRIVTWAGIIALICSCTYYYFDYRSKLNDKVLAEVEQKGLDMLGSNKINSSVKAGFIVNYERLHPGSFKSLLDGINNDTVAYDVAMHMFLDCENIDDKFKVKVNPFIYRLVDYLDGKLTYIYSHQSKIKGVDNFFKRVGEFARLCAFMRVYEKNHNSINDMLKNYVDMIYNGYIQHKFALPADSIKADPSIFNNALQLEMCFADNKKQTAKEILAKLSPYENEEAGKRFRRLYSKSSGSNTENNYTTRGDGYQELAYLYATASEPEMVISCFDTIIKYNPNYKNFWSENFVTLAKYLLLNKDISNQDVNAVFKKYEDYATIKHLKNIERFVEISGNVYSGAIRDREDKGPYTNCIYYVESGTLDRVYDYYLGEIKKGIEDKDELAFNLALYYKHRGITTIDCTNQPQSGDVYFKMAIDYYNSLPESYKAGDAVLGNAESANSRKIPRSDLFIYPVWIDQTNTWNPYYLWTADLKSAYFLDYVIAHNQTSLYKTEANFSAYQKFLYNYTSIIDWLGGCILRDSINDKYFDLAEKFVRETPGALKKIDTDFIYLVSSLRYFEKNDTGKAIASYKRTNPKVVFSPEYQSSENGGTNKVTVFQKLAEYFAVNSKSYVDLSGGDNEPNKHGPFDKNMEESMKLANMFTDQYRKKNALIDIALKLQEEGPVENAFIYLDTLYKEIDVSNKFGLKLLQVNGIIGGGAMNTISIKLIKDVNDKNKPRALVNYIRGIAHDGLYYRAKIAIPAYISSSNELELYTEILKAEIYNKMLPMKINSVGNPFMRYDINAEGGGTTGTGDYELGGGGLYLFSASD